MGVSISPFINLGCIKTFIYAYINFKVKAKRRLATEKERIKHKQEMFEKEKELSETFYRKEMSHQRSAIFCFA